MSSFFSWKWSCTIFGLVKGPNTSRCQFHQRFSSAFGTKPNVTRENDVRTKNLYIKCWWNWLQKTTTEAESAMLRNLFFRQQITVLNLNTTKSRRRLAISWILISVGHPKRSKNKTWFFHAKTKAKNESTFFIGNTGFYLHSEQKKNRIREFQYHQLSIKVYPNLVFSLIIRDFLLISEANPIKQS